MGTLSSSAAEIYAIDLLLRLRRLASDKQAIIELSEATPQAQIRSRLLPALQSSPLVELPLIGRLIVGAIDKYGEKPLPRKLALARVAARQEEAEALLFDLLNQELVQIDSEYAQLSAAYTLGLRATKSLDRLANAHTATLVLVAAAKHPRQKVDECTEPYVVGEIRDHLSELDWQTSTYAGAMEMFCSHPWTSRQFPALPTLLIRVAPEDSVSSMADLDSLQRSLRSSKQSIRDEQGRIGGVTKTLLAECKAYQQPLRQALEASFVDA